MDKLFGALSHAARREILIMLRAADLKAGEIADRLRMPNSTLSQHLKVLKDADLVTSDRDGTSIAYSLNTSVLEEGLLDVFNLFAVDKKPRRARQWNKDSARA